MSDEDWGAGIQARLDKLNISGGRFAQRADMNRKTVYRAINGESCTGRTRRQIERVLSDLESDEPPKPLLDPEQRRAVELLAECPVPMRKAVVHVMEAMIYAFDIAGDDDDLASDGG